MDTTRYYSREQMVVLAHNVGKVARIGVRWVQVDRPTPEARQDGSQDFQAHVIPLSGRPDDADDADEEARSVLEDLFGSGHRPGG